jgi:tetratricopeptide (TPR) repeat protein
VPPADQDSKKPAPSDSLLSDFDFGDDDFNWDKVGESLAPVLNSEDELPPELRRAVVPEAQPIAPAAPSPSLVAKPSEPEPAKPAEASPKVSPEPSAARAFDPLALPPLEGDAAPLPPILSTGLLGDLDLDLPVPPAAPVTAAKLEAKPAPAKPAVAVSSSLGELSDLALTIPAGLPSPSAVATAPSHITPSSVAVQIEVSDEQDEDYDVQIDAAPAAEDKPSAVSDASMSDLVPGFGQATSDSASAAAQKSTLSEPSVELSLPPPPALPVIEQLPVRIEPQPPVVAVAQPAPTTAPTRENWVALPPIQQSATPVPLRNQGTPIAPRRLPLPGQDNLPPPPPCVGTGAAPETATRRVMLALLDGEAQSHGADRGRTVKLLLAAGVQAEALREQAEAIERYRRVLELAPNHRTALRALRRLLSMPGPTAQPDEAATLCEREQKQSSTAEQSGLRFQQVELLRASGQLGEAKQLSQDFLSTVPKGSHKIGQCIALLAHSDVALAQGATAELATTLDGILQLPTLTGPLRPALQVARARLDEQSGRDQATAQRFESSLTASASLSAGLGLLRTSARLPRLRKDEPSPVAKAARAAAVAPIPTALKSALLCLAARQSTGNDRSAALTEAAQLGDSVARDELALTAEQAQDHAAAAAAYVKAAESRRDPWLRSEALRLAGRAFHRAGQDEAAQQALVQSLSAAAQSDVASDTVTSRLLERVCRKLGRPQDLLQMWRQQGQSSDGQGAFAYLYAADLQLTTQPGEAGRNAAMDELRAALKVRPDFLEAAQRLAELLLASNQPIEAAQVLLRASQQATTSSIAEVCRRVLREEAAAQLSRVGQHAEAAKVLLSDAVLPSAVAELAPTLGPARSWQLAMLAARLRGIAEPSLIQQLAEVLHAAAGVATGSRAAALWFARGSLLASITPTPSPDGGAVEESYRQALLAEPDHTMALLRLELRAQLADRASLRRSALSRFVTSGLRTRFERTKGTPAQPWWGIKLAVATEVDADEPALALRCYRELRQLTDGLPSLIGLDDWMYVTAWRAGQGLDLLERELSQDPDSDTRYALLVLAGEQLEGLGKSREAAERYQQALELRPGHPVARAKLVQALLAAGMLDELERFTKLELKEAPDIATRVQAYERQALLASLRITDPAERSEAIETAYRNVLTVDANNHLAMRALERHFISRGQWGELVHLYEQMGLTATDTPFAVHISSDRARLRQRLLWQDGGDEAATHNQMENDYRLALYRDRTCRPALRFLHEGAVIRNDQVQLAELSQRVGELSISSGPGEQSQKRSAAVFLTRAAEAAAVSGGDIEQVISLYRSALSRCPDQIPTLRGLLHYALLHQRYAVALDCAEQLAAQLYDIEERYLHYMLAGVLAQNIVPDAVRARRALRSGLELLPDREEAFERLRGSYATTSAKNADDARTLAALLTERLSRSDLSTTQVVGMRVELGQLYAGLLSDRPSAKRELGEALQLSPNQAAALYTLGKLYADDGEWQQAVEPLRRYSQLETRPAQLLAIHLLLGEIWSDQLHDSHQAIAEYTKAIQIQPTNQTALTKLADLFLAQNRAGETLPLLKRLVKYTEDKQRKIGYFHRIAALSELQGDSRGALEALRQAVEVDPMDLSSIRELARYYDRTSDVQSLRFHLDAAAGRFRLQLASKPRDQAVHQALLQILALRRSEQAQLAAGAIISLGGVVPKDLQTQLEKTLTRKEPTKSGLRDPSVDDVLYPAVVSSSIRMLFRLLAEPLGKMYVSDGRKLQALGVDRKEKLPRSGHPVRDLASKLAADLQLPEFDIYLTAAQGKDDAGHAVPHYTIEPLEPPALIISSSLLDGASEAERRFLLGGLLKILHSQLHLPLRMSSEDLAVLIGGLVRQQVKDYVPVGFADKRIETEAQRQRRAFPGKLATQIVPLAMEFYATVPNYDGIAKALTMSSHYFGLLWGGNLPAAVSALRRKGPAGEAQIDDLLRFALSREADEILRLLSGS